MSAIKMFFNCDVNDWIKKYAANFNSKDGAGLQYAFKSDGYKRFISKIRKYAYTKIGVPQAEGYVSAEPLSFENRLSGEHINLKIGKIWAKHTFDCMWVHCTGDCNNFAGDIKNLKFKIDIGGEGLVCDKYGNKMQGITNFVSEYDYSFGKPGKLIVHSEGLVENGKIDFWIDGAANDLFGKFQENAKIKCLDIVVANEEVRALAYDLEVLLSACEYANIDRANEIYSALKVVKRKCKFPITEEIAKECRVALKHLFEGNGENNFEYTAIGHAHLDLAWLWPIRETLRKGERTFATQLLNMQKYPEYYFGASQAQLFDWMKGADKQLYAKICDKVKSGQLEVQGATWVEMDSNLVGLESLIRQFYYGKKYFQKEFGLDMKILWLPDSFGYSGCLPQIMKLANVPYFLTQKMSWNTVTKFPYHTFNWVGIDGSEVFAHMLPNNSYNSPNRADNLIFGVNNFQEKLISNKALTLFGIGDGGAGPGMEHIERAKRLQNLPPVPRVKMGKAVDFFDDLVKERNKFNHYEGELYLEKHQGTYTTQVLVKYYNRKCEFALRNYELLVALSACKDLPISMQELEEIWKEILLYQFHDILPGSSIDRVYDECVPRYQEILEKLEEGTNTILRSIACGNEFFNPISYDIEHYYQTEDKWFKTTLPKLSITPQNDENEVSDLVSTDKVVMENKHLKIVFEKGEIKHYFDKRLQKDFVAQKGSFLKYSIYNDFGDCWDMRKNYANSKKSMKLVAFDICSDGVMAIAASMFSINKIVVMQEVSLTGDEDFARVQIHIWNESNKKMLRVQFDSNIKTDECAFNTQNGHIYRKTTENTKEEIAQYEVSGQKFVHMSDGEAGLAIINDCKYGFRCKGSTIDMNLIRSPKNPAYDVDKGEFHVKLAIYTHKGDVDSEVYKRAYMINNPVVECRGKGDLQLNGIEIDNQNVVVESVKVADNGGIVVRLYNSSASEQIANINVPNYENMQIVNILEDVIADFNGTIKLHKFEVVNIRFF